MNVSWNPVTDELLTIEVPSYCSLRAYWHSELEMLWLVLLFTLQLTVEIDSASFPGVNRR
jgi:hypothetical protein